VAQRKKREREKKEGKRKKESALREPLPVAHAVLEHI
jgi:hypothetical protein